MRTITDKAIVLKRVEYGEADRIVTFLTKSNGRIETIVKGCRKPASKLAGGIEPFTENDLSWIPRTGEGLHIIRSARGDRHFQNIMQDYDLLQIAYELLAITEKVSRAGVEESLYEVSVAAFELIDNDYDTRLIELWFRLQILRLYGHQLDLSKDSEDNKLDKDSLYALDVEAGSLRLSSHGRLNANHIKALRLVQEKTPRQLSQIGGLGELADDLMLSVKELCKYHL